ncbi:sensor histidine kinase, partial [Clostridium perfringens]|nr:sensor histidine kinase [Clostridium perfringens]
MEYKVEYENPKLQYYILRIIYILIILSAVLFIRKEKYIMFYKFLDLSSVIMLGTSLLIGISINVDKEKNLVSYTNMGIFWFIIPEVFSSFVSLELYVVDKMIAYKIIGLLFQYFITLVIVLGKKKNLAFKKINKMFLLLNIIFNIIYIIVINNTKLIRVFIKGLYINNF